MIALLQSTVYLSSSLLFICLLAIPVLFFLGISVCYVLLDMWSRHHEKYEYR